jgi:hypothetical protein
MKGFKTFSRVVQVHVAWMSQTRDFPWQIFSGRFVRLAADFFVISPLNARWLQKPSCAIMRSPAAKAVMPV